MEQAELKPYQRIHFPILAYWVTGPEMLLQFSGTEFTYPITQAQLDTYATKYPDRQFYIGYYQGMPVFFGEIIPQEGPGPRLGRLLIGDHNYRRKGLGMLFTRLLINECRTRFNATAVELFVWENNTTAIGCYKKIGFDFIPIDPFVMVQDGVEYNLKKMRISTEDEKLKSR